MIRKIKKIDSVKAVIAAKRSVEFWARIDGNKLARIGKNEKDMDLIGLKKKRNNRLEHIN